MQKHLQASQQRVNECFPRYLQYFYWIAMITLILPCPVLLMRSQLIKQVFSVNMLLACLLASHSDLSECFIKTVSNKIGKFQILQIDWLTCFMLPEPWPSFLKVINHNHQEFYFLLASRPLLPWADYRYWLLRDSVRLWLWPQSPVSPVLLWYKMVQTLKLSNLRQIHHFYMKTSLLAGLNICLVLIIPSSNQPYKQCQGTGIIISSAGHFSTFYISLLLHWSLPTPLNRLDDAAWWLSTDCVSILLMIIRTANAPAISMQYGSI